MSDERTGGLSIKQASEILNVSEEYMIRLLKEGAIRLEAASVREFKGMRDRERRVALRALTQMTEDFGGYDLEPEMRLSLLRSSPRGGWW